MDALMPLDELKHTLKSSKETAALLSYSQRLHHTDWMDVFSQDFDQWEALVVEK
jgi:hypothetical protein